MHINTRNKLILSQILWNVTLLAISLVVTTTACAETAVELRNIEARHTVESFCKAEFSGDEVKQRRKFIKYSSAREKNEKERSGWASPWVVYWDWDPYFIISRYRVVSVEVANDSAVATVEYMRLAESKGKEQIIPSRAANDIVKLNLVHDGIQWWIIDPPLPRISKDRIERIYEDKLRGFDDKWRARASNEQKKSYLRAQEALKVLKSLQD
jgi:hypothetical protein